jgi:hypothetical protein
MVGYLARVACWGALAVTLWYVAPLAHDIYLLGQRAEARRDVIAATWPR